MLSGEVERSGPSTVAIFGSCITRDAFNSRFNPDYKRHYTCVLMQNQSSLISLMSQPVDLAEDDYTPGSSEYDRWNVRTDTSKEFLGALFDASPGYLVLDFFGDVHFGILQLPGGSAVTNNRWKLWPTPFYRRMTESGDAVTMRVQDDPDAYMSRWREAFDAFMAMVRRELPNTVVVLHRGRNTDRLWLPDKARTVSLRKHRKVTKIDVELYDACWRMFDDYAAAAHGVEVIDLTEEDFPTFDDHPWGPFYVHYSMDYYGRFLGELHQIHLARSGVDPAKLADIATFGAATAARKADQLEAALEREQERVRASEKRAARGTVSNAIQRRALRGVRRLRSSQHPVRRP
ncbi:hypothetical protein KV097_00960 [Mumia sp. zg.B17]|uniref:DUF6270 domain-containing protein n=1 Tax=Mumia sp. zg.B17 TaxID=2855446 RepID=UPI001C6F02EC|nr:DUF6270 domain-containing protein [Mumia sp. zg.B17]MBW9204497.1 hypothetical protein [Mumia sp. zg.B17]